MRIAEATQRLFSYARDERIALRSFAARRCSILDQQTFYSLLRLLFQSEDPETRELVPEAIRLRYCCDTPADPGDEGRRLLGEALGDPGIDVQRNALSALSQLWYGAQELCPLVEAVVLTNEDEQNLREEVLTRLRTQHSDSELSPPEPQTPFAEMTRRHEQEIADLQRSCPHENPSEKMQECWAIGHFTDWQVVACNGN